MRVLIVALLIILPSVLAVAWWKLFKLGNKKRKEVFELAGKQLQLASQENISGKKLLRLIFYTVLVTILVFGGSAIINRLLGN